MPFIFNDEEVNQHSILSYVQIHLIPRIDVLFLIRHVNSYFKNWTSNRLSIEFKSGSGVILYGIRVSP